ncbi:hypothetical protein Hypma_014214 [Hypsizygus marmoreus]|uniref:Uncharacterized protein n=1 Tax=Hypsizygus marmoreus TaxID=39966 RepID=A0A369JBB1_HYPMA|nr:hypothetical protein Hypma_014214 [Hypsizygus marmoreus]
MQVEVKSRASVEAVLSSVGDKLDMGIERRSSAEVQPLRRRETAHEVRKRDNKQAMRTGSLADTSDAKTLALST